MSSGSGGALVDLSHGRQGSLAPHLQLDERAALRTAAVTGVTVLVPSAGASVPGYAVLSEWYAVPSRGVSLMNAESVCAWSANEVGARLAPPARDLVQAALRADLRRAAGGGVMWLLPSS